MQPEVGTTAPKCRRRGSHVLGLFADIPLLKSLGIEPRLPSSMAPTLVSGRLGCKSPTGLHPYFVMILPHYKSFAVIP